MHVSAETCCGRCGSRPARRSPSGTPTTSSTCPIKVAGKSGTAEFGTRDSKGRLPFHSWFVGFVPQEPRTRRDFDQDRTRSWSFLAFAYDSRTKGNAATEIAKYFLQLHFHIKKDYLNRDLLERGNFYQSN